MGFIEPLESVLNEQIANKYEIPCMTEPYEERFCICDPKESFHEIPSGKFDTYIALYKEPTEMRFLGSFTNFDRAVSYLTELHNNGITFTTAPTIESEYYNSDYSDKKQSIFI
jgi:hypothetical protein